MAEWHQARCGRSAIVVAEKEKLKTISNQNGFVFKVANTVLSLTVHVQICVDMCQYGSIA